MLEKDTDQRIRRLLTSGLVTVTALTVVGSAAPTAAFAASATPVLAAPVLAAAAAPGDVQEASMDQRIAAADVFGLGSDAALLGRTGDCNFVIGIWEYVNVNRPAFREVRTTAEQAFTESGQPCYTFIATEIFAAKRRDDLNAVAEAAEKRRSDLARSTAAASIDVVADATLLSGTDEDFARRIWERVAESPKWQKVKVAARTARDGTVEQQRQFIEAGMGVAAKQDIDDEIARIADLTEAERIRLLNRAAKQSAANRIGLAVTEQLLSLPDRDFVVTVWNNTADGTEVRAAAIEASRSLEPAVWKAFIDTGIHRAVDRDIQIALDKEAADNRKLVEDILARAEQTGQRNLAAAARIALAGTPRNVDDFRRTGQYAVPLDTTNVPGHGFWQWRNGASGRCLGAGGTMANGTKVTQTACGTDDQQWLVMRTGGVDGQFRIVNAKNQTKCLSMPADASAATVDVIVSSCDGGPAQTWQRRALVDGYEWTNPATNRTIGAQGTGIPENAQRVFASASSGTESQRWIPTGTQVVLSGNRIGVLTDDGVARVKEGTLSAGWTTVATGVEQLVLDGTRIGVLGTDGVARVKEGTLSAGWSTQYSGVKQLVLAGDRIGVLDNEGVARVKEGTLNAGWVTELVNVKRMALVGDRIGVLTADGILSVKEGTLSAVWSTQHTGVRQLALAGNRIGVVTNDGTARVKEGTLNAAWINEFTGVKQLVLAGDRIGVLPNDGTARVKAGSLSAGWVVQSTGIRELTLAGTRIGLVDAGNAAWVKEGALTAPFVKELQG